MMIYEQNNEIPLDYTNEVLTKYLKRFQEIDEFISAIPNIKLVALCHSHKENNIYISLHLTGEINEDVYLPVFGYLRKSDNCIFNKKLKAFKEGIKNLYLPIIEKQIIEKELSSMNADKNKRIKL